MGKSKKTTPGPYTIVEREGGVEVKGIYGVGVAWFKAQTQPLRREGLWCGYGAAGRQACRPAWQ